MLCPIDILFKKFPSSFWELFYSTGFIFVEVQLTCTIGSVKVLPGSVSTVIIYQASKLTN